MFSQTVSSETQNCLGTERKLLTFGKARMLKSETYIMNYQADLTICF